MLEGLTVPRKVWRIGLKLRSAPKNDFLVPESTSSGDELCRLGNRLWSVSKGPMSLPALDFSPTGNTSRA